MKAEFLKLSNPQIKDSTCLLLQGANEAYMNFCLDSALESLGKAVKEFYTQEEFLEKPDVIQNQADLFAPVGESKVIIVTHVSDKIYNSVVSFCQADKQPNKLILVPASSLKQTKTKTFLTTEAKGLMVNCYLSSPSDKVAFITTLAQRSNVSFERDAMLYLVEQLDDALDNLKTDIEKVKIYISPRTEISLEDLKQTLSINISNEVVELVDSIGTRNRIKIQESIQKAEYNGFDTIMILRYLSIHFTKLLQLKAMITNGTNLSQAFMQIKPAIFFKLQDSYKRQIGLWQETEILKLLNWLTKAEISFKTGDILHDIKIKKLFLSLGR